MVMNPTALKRAGAAALALYAGNAFADSRLEARRHFRNGMSLIAQGQYDPGIAELLEAYSIKPHANVLYNIARAYQDAGRTVEAVDYYRRYLAANPPDSDPVRDTLARLETTLQLSAPPQAAQPPKSTLPAMPPPPGTDTRALAQMMERLEKAITRAEALQAAPPPAPVTAAASGEGAPTGDTTVDASADDVGAVPYEELVVTASRRAQSSLEAPNATTVITADDIRQSGATTLVELLRRVPGAEVMMMGPGSANLSLRGFNQRLANKVLVLLDGRTEYQDFLGITVWSAIPVELADIERIEVIRGPGSALYGANAMFGVVNIITRAPGTGPRARFQAFGGNGNTAGGSFVSNGGAGALRFRASAAYGQTDKWSRDFAGDRPDIALRDPEPNLGVRSARATLATTWQLSSTQSLGLSGGVNRLYSEVYPLGVLRNFFLDGVTAYAKADANLGAVKIKAFWNHLNLTGGPQYEAVGQRSLVKPVSSHLLNGEVLFSQNFTLLGEHQVNVGAEGRLKHVDWEYLSETTRQEFHAAAFIQDEWRLAEPLRIVASYRVDRHPLLGGNTPGLAQSPRVSALYLPFEGHAFRASAASAFRVPTFLESYAAVRVPIPGVTGATAISQGNTSLKTENLLAFELGYRGEAPALGMDWDVALYQNRVSNLIQLSGVQRSSAGEAWDAVSGTYLLGRSSFTNEDAVYTARGAEAGLTLAPVDGLGIKASAAFQSVSAQGEALCGPCLQAPQFKVYGGVTYRTRQALELGVDVAWTSSTTWVEREPAAADPTAISLLPLDLGGYTIINARVGYTPVKDTVSVSLVGSNLGASHFQHPFGNRIERRVLALLTVTP